MGVWQVNGALVNVDVDTGLLHSQLKSYDRSVGLMMWNDLIMD